MKNERINIRTTEKTKLKLLAKSQYYNMSLSDFMPDVTESACGLDTVQIWIHAYVEWCIKRNRKDLSPTIEHYTFETGEDAWSVPTFKNTYESRFDFLEELRNTIKYHFDHDLPQIYNVLDNWEEFTRRLELLGLYKDEVGNE